MWDKKFGQEVYEVFSSIVSVAYDAFVDFMSSILPGLGEEFIVDYIKELSISDEYQRIVWDTAPLGQTLRLLETPMMLRTHLKPAPRIYSRLKLGKQSRRPVIEILKGWERLSGEDMEFLRRDVDFTLVTIAEALAIEQLDGIFAELDSYGFKTRQLVVNNVVKEVCDSPFLKEKARQQKPYLETVYRKYSHLQIIEMPLFPHEIKGVSRLALVEQRLYHAE